MMRSSNRVTLMMNVNYRDYSRREPLVDCEIMIEALPTIDVTLFLRVVVTFTYYRAYFCSDTYYMVSYVVIILLIYT